MNKNRIKRIVIFMWCFITLMYSGCTSSSRNKVFVERKFLYDIEKAVKQESVSGRDQSAVYNQIWESNYYELIYLTTKGDRQAIDVSISLIGQKGDPACLFEEIGLLVKPTFESDPDYFWEALEKRENDVQIKVLHMFEFHQPIDWNIDEYFVKHPGIKKLYENKYGSGKS